MEKTRSVGRPKEALDLQEGWQIEVLDLYKVGASDVEIKALIYGWRKSFSNDLWIRWMIDEPEFSETVKMGRVLSESWWAESGRTNLKDKDFSYTGWYMNMKNRFGWADSLKTDVTTNGKDIHPPIKWVDGDTE